jgi:PPOX class probable F420-dependent enzyme
MRNAVSQGGTERVDGSVSFSWRLFAMPDPTPREGRKSGGVVALSAPQRHLLEASKTLFLATIHRDGRPQLTPVWYLWADEAFWISTTSVASKVRNIRADQRVTMCIDGDAMGAREYVQVSGIAMVLTDGIEAMTLQLIRRYYDSEPKAQERWQTIRRGRVLIRVLPTHFQWRD